MLVILADFKEVFLIFILTVPNESAIYLSGHKKMHIGGICLCFNQRSKWCSCVTDVSPKIMKKATPFTIYHPDMLILQKDKYVAKERHFESITVRIRVRIIVQK